jgi:hypothetical protein
MGFRVCVRTRSWKGTALAGLCRPSGTRHLNRTLPGTPVPGYRLCRPSGTRQLNRTLPGTPVPGYRLCRPFGTRQLNRTLPGTPAPGYRLCRPFGTRQLNRTLPGTPVPGYRLCRAFGTRQLNRTLPGTPVPGYRLCRAFGTRQLNRTLPGTPVPGYRLCRPSGTAPLGHRARLCVSQERVCERIREHAFAAKREWAIKPDSFSIVYDLTKAGPRSDADASIPLMFRRLRTPGRAMAVPFTGRNKIVPQGRHSL